MLLHMTLHHVSSCTVPVKQQIYTHPPVKKYLSESKYITIPSHLPTKINSRNRVC